MRRRLSGPVTTRNQCPHLHLQKWQSVIRAQGRRPWRPGRWTRHRDASRARRPAPPRPQCSPSGPRFLFAAYRVTPRAAPSPCWRLRAPTVRHCVGRQDLQRIMHDRRSSKSCADGGGEAALTHHRAITQQDPVLPSRPALQSKTASQGQGRVGRRRAHFVARCRRLIAAHCW